MLFLIVYNFNIFLNIQYIKCTNIMDEILKTFSFISIKFREKLLISINNFVHVKMPYYRSFHPWRREPTDLLL